MEELSIRQLHITRKIMDITVKKNICMVILICVCIRMSHVEVFRGDRKY